MTPYHHLPLSAYEVALRATKTPYKGIEMPGEISVPLITRIESLRHAMTQEQAIAFALQVDNLCKHAYLTNCYWFAKLLQSQSLDKYCSFCLAQHLQK